MRWSLERVHSRRLTFPAALLTASLLVLAGCGGGGSSNASHRSSAPKVGGKVVVGDEPFGYLPALGLDPAAPSYGLPEAPITLAVLGSLFRGPTSASSPVVPDLASRYAYSDHNRVLTITLRPHLKFQDGTPLNAAAVVWNLRRYANPGSPEGSDFPTVTSMKGIGSTTVRISFSQPNAVLIDQMADTSAGYMASPTYFNKIGEATFTQHLVGAGPYRETASAFGSSITLTRWPGYWDAAHVYLKTLIFPNTGADPTANLNDLKANTVQIQQFSPQITPPSLITSALGDSSLSHVLTPNGQATTSMVLTNVNKPPFNNLKARQALAYCTDRVAIAKDVLQGYVTPAWIVSGTSERYTSGTVNGHHLNAPQFGKALNPYSYNPSKAKSLVASIGGLSFQYEATATSPVLLALQQQYASCNIHMTFRTISFPQGVADLEDGNYQATSGGEFVYGYPGTVVRYQAENGGFNTAAGGWHIQSIFDDITAANATTNEAVRATLWHQIWMTEDAQVVDMPIISSGYYDFSNRCLKGVVSRTLGLDFTHAYLTCPL